MSQPSGQTPDQPNVVVITCHDLGRFLNCYGIETVQSPNLDRLAREGIRFDRAFCTAPQCSPSRASLYTGRYPHSNGVLGLTHANFGWDLHPDERHLAQELHEAGYATAMVGVHHESRRPDHPSPEAIGARLGFDEVHLAMAGEAVSADAVALLDRYADAGQPFYLQLGYREPHRLPTRERDEPGYMGFLGDYVEPDETKGVTIPDYIHDEPSARAEMAELQGAVRYVDGQIGRVLDRLRERGLDEDTLVVFTTDHGVALPRAKCSLYDPGLEVALIVRFPARDWTGGRVRSEMISNLDVFPTILEALGWPVSERVQGRSIRPLLDGEPYQQRTELFGQLTWHDYYDPCRCIRTDRHKLIVNFTSSKSFMDPSQSWRRRCTTVVPPLPERTTHPLIELYDLEADPLEHHNLSNDPDHSAVEIDLLARLHEWMVETDDPLLRGAVAPPMHYWALDTLAAAVATPTD